MVMSDTAAIPVAISVAWAWVAREWDFPDVCHGAVIYLYREVQASALSV